MAIKGKSKASKPRPRTNAPRPVIVQRKKPFFQRRSVRIGVLGLVLTAVAATLVIGYLVQKGKDRLEAQGNAIKRYTNLIQAAVVPDVAQAAPPSTITLFPTLVQDIENFRNGDVNVAEIRDIAEAIPTSVQSAITTIMELPIPKELQPKELSIQLIDGRILMSAGLQSYVSVAALLQTATELQGADRSALLDRAVEQAQAGQQLWSSGYGRLTNVQVDLGVFDPTQFQF